MENTPILLLFLFLPLLGMSQLNSPMPDRPDRAVRFYSENVKDTFAVSIQRPTEYTANPAKRYPVVVLTDGDFYFPTLAPLLRQYEMTGLLPPMILVGIGYGDFRRMDSLRTRDLLYPRSLASDELSAPGGGLDFYRFVTGELLPRLEADLRIDTAQRTLMGHSFGGYFALYTALQQAMEGQVIFSNIVSASPTLWYHDFYLNQLPGQLASTDLAGALNIIITAGNLESSEWTLAPIQKLTGLFNDQSIPNLYLNAFIYNFLDHMDTGQLSFVKGLRYFYPPARSR